MGRAPALVTLVASLVVVSGCGGPNPYRSYTQTDPVDSSFAREIAPGRFVIAVLADPARAPRVEALLGQALSKGGGGTATPSQPDPALVDHAFGPGGPFSLRPMGVVRYEAIVRAVGLDPKDPIDLVWKGGPETKTLRATGDAVRITVRGQGEYAVAIEGGVQVKGADLFRAPSGARSVRGKPFDLQTGGKPIAVEVLSSTVEVAPPALFYEVRDFGGDVRALVADLVAEQKHDAQGVVGYRMLQTTVWLEEDVGGAPAPTPAAPAGN